MKIEQGGMPDALPCLSWAPVYGLQLVVLDALTLLLTLQHPTAETLRPFLILHLLQSCQLRQNPFKSSPCNALFLQGWL
jgi:hypothetical protein